MEFMNNYGLDFQTLEQTEKEIEYWQQQVKEAESQGSDMAEIVSR